MNKKPGAPIKKSKKLTKTAKAKIIRYRKPLKITEIFTPGCIGHASAIWPDGIGPDVPDRIYVDDFLVDSSGLSKGGESVNPLIQVGLNNSQYIVYSILPEACKKGFEVKLPSGINRGHLSIHLGRKALHEQPFDGPGHINIYDVRLEFTDLKGPAPEITYTAFSIPEENNNEFRVHVFGYFTKRFSFTGIHIKCKYPKRDLLPAFDFYKLNNTASPFTVPAENFVKFGYDSRNLVDLGPVIRLV
jgi:hypothetical protein